MTNASGAVGAPENNMQKVQSIRRAGCGDSTTDAGALPRHGQLSGVRRGSGMDPHQWRELAVLVLRVGDGLRAGGTGTEEAGAGDAPDGMSEAAAMTNTAATNKRELPTTCRRLLPRTAAAGYKRGDS